MIKESLLKLFRSGYESFSYMLGILIRPLENLWPLNVFYDVYYDVNRLIIRYLDKIIEDIK